MGGNEIVNDYFAAMAETLNCNDVLFLDPSVTLTVRFSTPGDVPDSPSWTSFNQCKYVLICASNATDDNDGDTGSNDTGYHTTLTLIRTTLITKYLPPY